MEPTHILTSYPRSGNTWFRYAAEFLTERATGVAPFPGRGSRDGPLLKHQYPLLFHKTHEMPVIAYGRVLPEDSHTGEPNVSLFPRLRNHSDFKQYEWWLDPHNCFCENSKMVLLLRNYKDVIPSHLKHDIHPADMMGVGEFGTMEYINDVFESAVRGKDDGYPKNQIDSVLSYANCIKEFDEFDGDKIVFYYEDLISNVESFWANAQDKLNLKILSEKHKEFFENIEQHRQICLSLYGRSWTGGLATNSHSKYLSDRNKINWDNHMKAFLGNLYDEYLKCYEFKL